MHRDWIKQKLANYQPETPNEKADLEKLLALVTNEVNCFHRDNYQPGHITGSAWIVSHQRDHVLLTHHLKLNQWLQLGGHSDGHPNTFEVALREAQEESGLSSIKPLSEEIFDISIHTIPARANQPEHEHFDLRFLFEADRNEPFQRQVEESLDLRWIPIEQVTIYNQQEAFFNMVRKTLKKFPRA
jgi:8-oxo-dGTP pyrophosphatase MutT (NUDIX family)